ncbi:MAG: CHC2 zinc finger domain-containing protein, partial [bacterium]|nr:CHC2 zinc finger domain-containing protein [bacterium]
MADTVQQIKDRLSIVDVVSQHVKLTRAGASLRARCPFHAERTP